MEGKGFRDRIQDFSSRNAVVVGVSCDSPADNRAFRDKFAFPFFDLLSRRGPGGVDALRGRRKRGPAVPEAHQLPHRSRGAHRAGVRETWCPPNTRPRCWPRSTRSDDGAARRKDMAPTLRRAGEPAPAFRLPNQDGIPSDLADFRGRYLLLWWYPKAGTPG